jgi:hypothetical protein
VSERDFEVEWASDTHRLVSITNNGKSRFRRSPCEECPWRMDQVWTFPVQLFRVGAASCYDAAPVKFACHMSGKEKPAACAGFLLSESAPHNLAVRVGLSNGDLDLSKVHDGGHALFSTYRTMAIANGVAPDDPYLSAVRDNTDDGTGHL